jgi:uncharacterized membrane protein YsdA (DUF1294 family)
MLGLDWHWTVYLLIGVCLPQVVPFVFYGIDKFLAKVSGPRIPEMVLLASTFLFGGLGSVIAMYLFRHKTSKSSFKVKFYIVWFLRILLLAGVIALLIFYF